MWKVCIAKRDCKTCPEEGQANSYYTPQKIKICTGMNHDIEGEGWTESEISTEVFTKVSPTFFTVVSTDVSTENHPTVQEVFI